MPRSTLKLLTWSNLIKPAGRLGKQEHVQNMLFAVKIEYLNAAVEEIQF